MSSAIAQKAILFNLLTFASDQRKKESDFSTLLSVILKKFPVHLISIGERSGKPVVNESDDNYNVELDAKDLYLAPYYILPNLVSDLPIYLFWGEDPIEDKSLLPLIAKWSVRLIFDCHPPANLSEWSRKMLDWIKSSSLTTVDVNWTRIAGWRAVLAEICDCTERLRAFKECRSLKIYYNSSMAEGCHHPEIQALYLQAWLTASLDWKYQSIEKDKKSCKLKYESHAGDLLIELLPEEKKELPSCEIIKMEMACSQDMSFSLSKEDSQVMVYASTHELCHLPFTLPLLTLKKEQQFINELFYKPVTNHYIRTLECMINYGCF